MVSGQLGGLATTETVQIFLSYSARTPEESELSTRLVDFLASAFDLPPKAVFAYTTHGVTSGVNLFEGLKSALAASQVVLAIATPAVTTSSYSQFEAAASDLAGKFRVPLLPDPSFHTYVPAVFHGITARNLASLGELCRLVEDMKAPLGVVVQPSYLWITKAERVIEAARAVAGKAAPETQIAQLQTEVTSSESRLTQLRRVAALGGLAALTFTIGMATLWWRESAERFSLEQTQTALTTRNTELMTDLDVARGEIARINRRSLYLPTLQIDGQVLTPSGAKVERALVVACADLPYPGSMRPSDGHVCPEELGLPAETDSDGKFSIDLRSLPDLPDKLAPNGPLHEFWLTAQHSQGSVRLRVKPVNVQNLLLRR